MHSKPVLYVRAENQNPKRRSNWPAWELVFHQTLHRKPVGSQIIGWVLISFSKKNLGRILSVGCQWYRLSNVYLWRGGMMNSLINTKDIQEEKALAKIRDCKAMWSWHCTHIGDQCHMRFPTSQVCMYTPSDLERLGGLLVCCRVLNIHYCLSMLQNLNIFKYFYRLKY